MRNKVLAVHSTLEMPEKRAKRCQLSGRSPSSSASVGREQGALNRSPKIMRRLWILLCLLALPCVVCAQSNQTTWENLSGLQAGQKIQVAEMKSKPVSGTFVSVSSTAISLQEQGGEQTIQRQDIRSVKLMENKHRLRNVLIVGAVGAGAGAGIGAGAWENRGFTGGKGTGAGVGAVIGFVGGAIVGALWPSHKTVYRATGQ